MWAMDGLLNAGDGVASLGGSTESGSISAAGSERGCVIGRQVPTRRPPQQPIAPQRKLVPHRAPPPIPCPYPTLSLLGDRRSGRGPRCSWRLPSAVSHLDDGF